MQNEELTIIAPEELTVVQKVELEKLIKEYARIRKRKVDGVKRIAYPIQGRDRGLYLYYELSMEPSAVPTLSSKLNINDNIMRYLLVRQDNR